MVDFMLKDVLKCVYNGFDTIKLISKELELQESALLPLIEFLIQKDYLKYSNPQHASNKCAACPFLECSTREICFTITKKGVKHIKRE